MIKTNSLTLVIITSSIVLLLFCSNKNNSISAIDAFYYNVEMASPNDVRPLFIPDNFFANGDTLQLYVYINDNLCEELLLSDIDSADGALVNGTYFIPHRNGTFSIDIDSGVFNGEKMKLDTAIKKPITFTVYDSTDRDTIFLTGTISVDGDITIDTIFDRVNIDLNNSRYGKGIYSQNIENYSMTQKSLEVKFYGYIGASYRLYLLCHRFITHNPDEIPSYYQSVYYEYQKIDSVHHDLGSVELVKNGILHSVFIDSISGEVVKNKNVRVGFNHKGSNLVATTGEHGFFNYSIKQGTYDFYFDVTDHNEVCLKNVEITSGAIKNVYVYLSGL